MKILISALLTCLTTLSAVESTAQEIDVTRLSVGEHRQWDTDLGRTQITYQGKDAKGHKFQFQRDGSKDADDAGYIWTTRDGQTLSFETGTFHSTYSPHDCTLTLGECRFVERKPDNKSRSSIRVTQRDGSLWRYWLYHTRKSPQTLIEHGAFTVEDNGFIINHDGVLDTGRRLFARQK